MSEFLNELRDSAKQVVDGSSLPAKEDTTWPIIVELGWLLTAVPEDVDGLGLGIQEVTALHMELGRGLVEAPFITAMMAVEALSHSELGDKAERIATIAGGECATASLAESGVALTQGKLSGDLTAVLSADTASQLLVWTHEQDCVALIALEQPNVTVTARETWDITRRLFDVELNDVDLEQETVLATGEAAEELIARLKNVRDLALASDALGGGLSLLERTVEYLNTRQQFSRPLALFQALKHRCADMKTLLAGAEALLLDGVARIGDDLASEAATLTARKCKHLACDAFSNVAEEALQLHGGIGMATEHECHLFLKRAMLNEHLGGSVDSYPDFVADQFLAG